MRIAQFFLIACVMVAAEGNAPAQEYEIKLDRLEKVGNKYKVSLKGATTFHIVLIKGKKPLPPGLLKLTQAKPVTVISIELDAAVEVLRVDAAGRVLKKALTVERFEVYDFDDEFELDLTAGKVIIAETVEGATQFRLNRTRIKEHESQILGMVVTTYTGRGFQDANFGNNRRRKVSDTWPVRIDDVLAKGLFRNVQPDDLVVDKAKLEGNVKLVSVEQSAGIHFLRIDAQMRGIDCLVGDLSDDNVAIEKTGVEFSFSGWYPTDQTMRCLSSVQSRRCSVLMRSPKYDYFMKHSIEETVERKIGSNLKN